MLIGLHYIFSTLIDYSLRNYTDAPLYTHQIQTRLGLFAFQLKISEIYLGRDSNLTVLILED